MEIASSVFSVMRASGRGKRAVSEDALPLSKSVRLCYAIPITGMRGGIDVPNWTQEQQQAIEDRGHSLIVSAAAGSGKTAVLVERIVRLVREGCPIDSMLVVTFTNAAASEMRQRIGDALGIPCRVADAPGTCGIRGLYRIMEEPERYSAVILDQKQNTVWR